MNKKPVVVVSNHIGAFEILIHFQKFQPSVLAKEALRKVPVVGRILELNQTLFLRREKTKSREAVIK